MFGRGRLAARLIFFSRDWTAGDSNFKLQCLDLIACTGCVVAAYVVTKDLACCNSVTCQWCREIQGQLGIGGFSPICMICWTELSVLTTDFVIKLAQKNSLFLKSSISTDTVRSMQVCFNPI
jgi:hypothetical protein